MRIVLWAEAPFFHCCQWERRLLCARRSSFSGLVLENIQLEATRTLWALINQMKSKWAFSDSCQRKQFLFTWLCEPQNVSQLIVVVNLSARVGNTAGVILGWCYRVKDAFCCCCCFILFNMRAVSNKKIIKMKELRSVCYAILFSGLNPANHLIVCVVWGF